AQKGSQAAQRVNDLFARYAVTEPTVPDEPEPEPEIGMVAEDYHDVDEHEADSVLPAYPTSSGYPAPERQLKQDAPSRRTPGQGPMYPGPEIDDVLSELTQAYDAGDYQQAVDRPNRILAQQPRNPTALEYRQKAEDSLIRGVVPDHRIPFEAR